MAVTLAESAACKKRGKISNFDGQKSESTPAARPPNIGITTMVDSSLAAEGNGPKPLGSIQWGDTPQFSLAATLNN
jgi:hypothetical protein